MATTIDKYCYLTCRYLPPFFEHRIRVVYSKTEYCQIVDEIEHPSVRETLRFMKIDRGVEIHHDGDLPARSGMGASSSFTVGLLNAVYALKGEMPTKRTLATESIHIEQDKMKETVGCQDQIMAAFGGFNRLIFDKNGDFSVQPLIVPPAKIQELNDNLMLFYTGIARTGSDIANTYVHDLVPREKQLENMSAMASEGASILAGGDDIRKFGQLLDEAWRVKRSLSSNISNQLVDQIYGRALEAGAIGGKLLGAGGGGFMVFFVPTGVQSNVKEALNDLTYVPFEFETQGSQVIFYDQERDYSFEDRLRGRQGVFAFSEMPQFDS